MYTLFTCIIYITCKAGCNSPVSTENVTPFTSKSLITEALLPHIVVPTKKNLKTHNSHKNNCQIYPATVGSIYKHT